MDNSKHYDILAAIIILYDDNGRVLLQQRTDDAKKLPGYWAFFGGGIEDKETPKEAVIRECYEELRVSLLNPKLVLEREFMIKKQHGYMYVFVHPIEDKKMIELHEGQGLGWFFLHEIQHLTMIEHDKEILEYLFKTDILG